MKHDDLDPQPVDGPDDQPVVGYFPELPIVQRVWTAVAAPGFDLEQLTTLELLTLIADDAQGLLRAAAAIALRREQALTN